MTKAEALLSVEVAMRLNVMQQRLAASCANCPFSVMGRRARCGFSPARRLFQWITQCRVCPHHPALERTR